MIKKRCKIQYEEIGPTGEGIRRDVPFLEYKEEYMSFKEAVIILLEADPSILSLRKDREALIQTATEIHEHLKSLV